MTWASACPRALLHAEVERQQREARALVKSMGWTVMGKVAAQNLSPYRRAKSWEELGRLIPHLAAGSGQLEARKAAIAEFVAFRVAYRAAFERWRAGEREVLGPSPGEVACLLRGRIPRGFQPSTSERSSPPLHAYQDLSPVRRATVRALYLAMRYQERVTTLADLLHRQLNELIRLVGDPDPFAPIRSSNILRQMLNDSTQVVQQVQRALRQRGLPPAVRFTVEPSPTPEIQLSSDRMAVAGPSQLKLDHFLKVRVGPPGITLEDSNSARVGDLVKYAAHIKGGVHAGQPDADEEAISAMLSSFPNLGEDEALGKALRAIGRMVVDALQPARLELIGLGRFRGCPAFGFALVMSVIESDPEADIDIVSVGHRPGARLFIRDGTFRVILRSEHSSTLLEGPRVPQRERLWILLEVVLGPAETLVRLTVNGLEWVDIVESPQPLLGSAEFDQIRMGFSRGGVWAARFYGILATQDYGHSLVSPDLRAYAANEASRDGPAVVFAPGQGLESPPKTGDGEAGT